MTDLAYPIGPYVRPVSVSAADRAAWIAQFETLPDSVAAAVDGLDDAQLDTPYRPGGWTVRQVVHHLADSHVNALMRVKLGLTEDAPVIKPYDEQAWAELADYRMPLALSLTIIGGVHERLVSVLRSLPEEAFARPLHHPVTGAHTVDTIVALYAWHGRHHVAHITGLRQREGW